MDFGLSDSQQLLQRSIREYLSRSAPIERVRRIVESRRGDTEGADENGSGGGDTGGADDERDLYRELAEQGITSLLIAEQAGGSGLGLLDACIAAQELGRHVTPCSFHSASVAAPILLQAGASQSGPGSKLSHHWLERISDGSALVAVILDGLTVDHGADDGTDHGTVDGTALYVPDADVADGVLVRSGDELHLFPAGHLGLTSESLHTVDGTRRIGDVRFDHAKSDQVTRIELPGPALRAAVKRAREAQQVALAADTLGACQEALRIAVDYSLERRQFDRVIGSFQAVKHLCAETVAAIEPIQSLLWYAAFAWDEQLPEAASLAPLLLSHASEVGAAALSTTTQVMGGIGFTHESDMHLYYKRVGYNRQMLGSPESLRAEAAELRYGPMARQARAQS